MFVLGEEDRVKVEGLEAEIDDIQLQLEDAEESRDELQGRWDRSRPILKRLLVTIPVPEDVMRVLHGLLKKRTATGEESVAKMLARLRRNVPPLTTLPRPPGDPPRDDAVRPAEG